MEITGKLVKLVDAQTGTSARGEWKKQQFIIETEDQYPKKICIQNWNDKVDLNAVSVGDKLTVSINIESREFNEKWYTDVQAWRMESSNQTENKASAPPISAAPEEMPLEPDEDDLPF